MIPARVQVKWAKSSGNSVSVALTGVTNGNTIYVAAVVKSTTALAAGAVVDNITPTNTWVQLGAAVAGGGGVASGAHWYCKTVTTNGGNITLTLTAPATVCDLVAYEVSGVDQTTPIDVAIQAGATAAGKQPQTSSVTTTYASDLLLAWTGQADSSLASPGYWAGTGWAIDPADANDSSTATGCAICTAHAISGAAGGSYIGMFNQPSATTWVCGMVALKGAAGAPAIRSFVNVKDPAFGAIGDSRDFTDASITHGTTLLTRTVSWLQTDIGKRVDVVGAGGTGASPAVLTATISNVSGSSATLSGAAANDVTNARGSVGTDDTNFILAAVNALPQSQGFADETTSNGGVAYLPVSNYKISSIQLPGEVTLLGNRNGSILTATPPTNARGAVELVRIAGYYTIDGVRIRDLTINTHQGYGITVFNPAFPPPAVTTSTTGGNIPGNFTYWFQVTFYNASGETLGSELASVVVPSTTNTNTITVSVPAVPAGYSGFNVYLVSYVAAPGPGASSPAGGTTGIRVGTSTGAPVVLTGATGPTFGSPGSGSIPPGTYSFQVTFYKFSDPATETFPSATASQFIGTTEGITVNPPAAGIPTGYDAMYVYLVGRTVGTGTGKVGGSTAPVRLSSLTIQPGALPATATLSYEISDCIISAANSGIYFRGPSAYSQLCLVERNKFMDIGHAAIVIDGNANVLRGNDVEGGVRAGFPLGGARPNGIFEVRGSLPTVEENIIEIVNAGAGQDAVSYYFGPTQQTTANSGGGSQTGRVQFRTNWAEQTTPYQIGGVGRVYTFDSVVSADISELSGLGTVDVNLGTIRTAYFNNCYDCRIRRLDVSTRQTATPLSECIVFGDAGTVLLCDTVFSYFDPGDLENPQIVVRSYYNDYVKFNSVAPSGFSAAEATNPLTGNLCPNGDLEMGTYLWTLTLGDHATSPGLSVRDHPSGIGKQLVVNVTISATPTTATTLTAPASAVPSGMVNAPGFVRFGVVKDATATVDPLFWGQDGVFSLTRATNGTVIIPCKLASGSNYWQMSAAGTYYFYIDNFQVTLGKRGNTVPDGTAQRRWLPSRNIEIQDTTLVPGPPTLATWPGFSAKIGDIVWNHAPVAGGTSYIGWVCTTAGSPGTWRTFGLVT